MAETPVLQGRPSTEPTPAPPSNHATTSQAISPTSKPQASIYQPWEYQMSKRLSYEDPLFAALRFKWADFQHIGRQTFDTMYKHPAVAAPFDSLISFLKSYRPMFKPVGANPTKEQKQYADFSNEQIRRLGAIGDPRQGWECVVDWFSVGLKYGFTLAEMETVGAAWRGQRRTQIKRIIPLPQGTLDNGATILEELGQGIMPGNHPRYHCFVLDDKGTVLAVRQFHYSQGGPQSIEWTGGKLLRILHFAHNSTEGNPFGRSMFFSAFYPWSDLYTLEQMEAAFLDASMPYLTVSYKTPDGRSSPAMHAQVLEIIKQQDPSTRALIMPDTTFGSVAPSNPSFTEHVTAKKDELRRYIFNAIMGIPVMNSNVGNELDARNAIQVFFKYLVPSLQREISTLMTWQFSRRLIDANWSGLSESDYPELVFQNTLDNDVRVAMPLLQQILPFVDHTRIGEMLQSLVPGFERDWIPTTHEQSMQIQRAAPDPAVAGKSSPPTKQPGTPDTQHTGTTSNLGSEMDTKV